MNYRLFYNYKVSGDVLFILIDPEKEVTRFDKTDNVVALYSGDELVGINIFELKDVVKIKSSGAIMAPADELVDVINSIIAKASLPSLPKLNKSGYTIAEIKNLEEHPVDEKASIVTLSLGEREIVTVSRYKNLEIGAKVVVATEGTILVDGSVFHSFVSRNIANDASIMEAKELKIESEKPGAFIVEEGEAGEDFFYGGNER